MNIEECKEECIVCLKEYPIWQMDTINVFPYGWICKKCKNFKEKEVIFDDNK